MGKCTEDVSGHGQETNGQQRYDKQTYLSNRVK